MGNEEMSLYSRTGSVVPYGSIRPYGGRCGKKRPRNREIKISKRRIEWLNLKDVSRW